MTSQSVVDEEGDVITNALSESTSYFGNVQFVDNSIMQRQYGIDELISLKITTSLTTEIEVGDIIKYNNVLYNVSSVLIRDSHIEILCKLQAN